MQVHECARCEGCGYITGSFRWEIPWSRWADMKDQNPGFLEAHACPDCGGTGALLQMETIEVPEVRLPSRRGLPRGRSYEQHVKSVLRSQLITKH